MMRFFEIHKLRVKWDKKNCINQLPILVGNNCTLYIVFVNVLRRAPFYFKFMF